MSLIDEIKEDLANTEKPVKDFYLSAASHKKRFSHDRVAEMELALIAAHEKIERLEKQNEQLRALDANGWRADMESAPRDAEFLVYSEITGNMEVMRRSKHGIGCYTHWRHTTLPEEVKE